MRALIFLAFTIAGVALSLLLGGCGPQLLKGSGVPADAPIGKAVACAKDSALEICKP